MTDNTTNIREVVLDVLLEVLENHNLSHIVLQQALEKSLFLERQARAFITRCVEGTLEYRIQIDAVLDRFSKVKTAKMKPVIRDLVMPHVENHERILEAAMKPNFGLAYEAFMNDPLVHGRISREDGEKLLKEMIQNTLDVLPEGWKKEIQ